MTTQRHTSLCGVFKGTPRRLSIPARRKHGGFFPQHSASTADPSGKAASSKGFSLVELLVMIATIAILSVFLFPGLSRAKEGGRKITCMNNLKQLGYSLKLYSDANNGWYPPRTVKGRWPTQLFVGYKNHRILKCPSDILRPDTEERDAFSFPADAAPRSYILNGWNDLLRNQLGAAFSFDAIAHKAIRSTDILQPAQTVVFGEKPGSPGQGRFYMDILEGQSSYDKQVEQGRHASSGSAQSEGSNYAFADGSAQFLAYGRMNFRKNLWIVTGMSETNRLNMRL